jgi:hypothetical protein
MIVTQRAADMLAKRWRELPSRLAWQYPHFVAVSATITTGWVVRNPTISGRVELVSDREECACRYGRVFGICRHMVAVGATELDWMRGAGQCAGLATLGSTVRD